MGPLCRGLVAARPSRHARWRTGFSLWLVVWACGDPSGAPPPTCHRGDEGCECFPNGTCNDDLECRAEVCAVPAPAGEGGEASGSGAASAGEGGAAGQVGSSNPSAGRPGASGGAGNGAQGGSTASGGTPSAGSGGAPDAEGGSPSEGGQAGELGAEGGTSSGGAASGGAPTGGDGPVSGGAPSGGNGDAGTPNPAQGGSAGGGAGGGATGGSPPVCDVDGRCTLVQEWVNEGFVEPWTYEGEEVVIVWGYGTFERFDPALGTLLEVVLELDIDTSFELGDALDDMYYASTGFAIDGVSGYSQGATYPVGEEGVSESLSWPVEDWSGFVDDGMEHNDQTYFETGTSDTSFDFHMVTRLKYVYMLAVSG